MHVEENLMEYMESPEGKEQTRKWIEEYFGEIEKKKEQVSSKEYIDWLYDFVIKNNGANDESALYTYEGDDAENGKLLSYFMSYIQELAKEQRVTIVPDEECSFPSEMLTVKIKDKYFEVFTMYGQGSFTSVNLLEKEPNYAFVRII